MLVGWAVLKLETFGTFSLKGFFTAGNPSLCMVAQLRSRALLR